MSLSSKKKGRHPFTGWKDTDVIAIIEDARSILENETSAETTADHLQAKGLDRIEVDLVLDVVSTRSKASEKFRSEKEVYFTAEGLRWATPEEAAHHCAGRIKREFVMDLTCGQGGQVLSLARTCERVVAVDKDPVNCLLTRLNLISAGLDNVEVMSADCLSPEVLERTEADCAVFSDPSRPPGSRERTMEEIVPDPRKVEKAYRGRVSGMCFEIPPYISLEKVPFDCEAEYISLDGRLNRLNIYLGDLKVAQRSAVVLPGGHRISGLPRSPPKINGPSADASTWLSEMDPAVARADLVELLMARKGWDARRLDLDKRRTVLLSDRALFSAFIKGSFRVIGRSGDLEEVRSLMEDHGIGSAVLRFNVPPSLYWSTRNRLEEGLSGKLKAHLFRDGGYILALKENGRRSNR